MAACRSVYKAVLDETQTASNSEAMRHGGSAIAFESWQRRSL